MQVMKISYICQVWHLKFKVKINTEQNSSPVVSDLFKFLENDYFEHIQCLSTKMVPNEAHKNLKKFYEKNFHSLV